MSRLIDADSLIDLVEDSTILTNGFKCLLRALVNGEPTAEDRPTGKWQRVRKGVEGELDVYACDKCREKTWHKSKFCPNCGAKMIGSEERREE